MTKYLLDTNIILRFSNPDDDRHQQIYRAGEQVEFDRIGFKCAIADLYENLNLLF